MICGHLLEAATTAQAARNTNISVAHARHFFPKKEYDWSSRIQVLKLKHFKPKKPYVVGLSTWIAQTAKKCKIFNDCEISNIPNPIDTTRFKPIDRKFARDLWGISYEKRFTIWRYGRHFGPPKEL